MNKKKICFIMDNDPNFLGGTAVYVKNIAGYLEKNKVAKEICCVYPGKENKEYFSKNVRYVELKTFLPFPLKFFEYAKKVNKFLENEKFDVINSHAMAGYFMKNFNNKYGAKLVHTYHGVAYYFYSTHLTGKNLIKKIGSIPFMILGKILESPPVKKADNVICVSSHVKNELDELYDKKNNKIVIRTGVDTSKFKKIDSSLAKKNLNLDPAKKYLLYVGRGGYWRKGLDRAVKLMKEVHIQDKEIGFLIVGPENNSANLNLIKEVEDFSSYIPTADRETISNYYNASEIFFCFSRYEGGAPIMTLGEAMASECLPVCSKDANQEIIREDVNGLIVNKFDSEDARKIILVMNNKKIVDKLVRNSIKTIKSLSLDKWGTKYLKVLFNGKSI